MQHARDRQREFRDDSVELQTVCGDHTVFGTLGMKRFQATAVKVTKATILVPKKRFLRGKRIFLFTRSEIFSF
jgi:hypothetical protein